MKIIVLIKQVPDTWSDRRIDTATGLIDRAASDRVIDEISERALEVALARKDGDKATEVVVMTMGPPEAKDALRKALAMGADSAVHISDEGLTGADALLTSSVIAAAARDTGFDLLLTGNESTDGRGGILPAMLAEHLGLPVLSFLDHLDIDAGTVRGRRSGDAGTLELSAALPAVISITEQLPDARFASFKGIMTAKKKPVVAYGLVDLETSAMDARSTVLAAEQGPPRTAGTVVVDDGRAVAELVDYLAAARLV
ncbi:electron transfer flavoprotein subunit beta/FixA family protein [Microcella daejeonensis]|uniref:Electron transfer flavoprotein subunit beta n=1 Tax=Microcella daejeonensis TaxID=2994971 RepID=A0A9E8MMT3_9MICO|nr:electron transfer flavoprotein subunit beta/FixA family protein [Microcella daejeonensis]WAB82560.1 electron transfer flavoprotein subunit beta/FixA family protein [Microcella daejeonensis]